ncbi:MAG TPA: hypothetical protein VLA24_11840 [Pseudomonadales bacterium]|nr:hypothetical protein [Pseudomonadales bacterium]
MAKIGNQGDGGGRPPVVFDEAQTAQVEALAAVLSKGQMADYFGISENTLREIEERQPEVSEAYKRGKAKAIGNVAKNLISQAQMGNITAAIFYLKTQAGWKEDKEAERDLPPINVIVRGNGTD